MKLLEKMGLILGGLAIIGGSALMGWSNGEEKGRMEGKEEIITFLQYTGNDIV